MIDLSSRLAALRRRIQRITFVRGACWLGCTAVLAVSLAGLADFALHLPSTARALLLVLALVGSCAVAYAQLWQPLQQRTDDLALAIQLETAYPHLADSLASAVQFLDHDHPERLGSTAFRQATIEQAARRAARCDFRRIAPSRGMWSASASCAGAAALAGGLILLSPPLAWTALDRLALPFGGREWPRQTEVDVTGPDRLARGDTFEAVGRAFGRIPDHVVVQFDGLTPGEQRAVVHRTARDGQTFGAFQHRVPNVARDFRYRVVANDATTEWRSVQVAPPPMLAPLAGRASPQVRLEFPRYTGLVPVELPDGNGNVEAIAGTRIRFRAAVDRPLARAWIEYLPDQALAPLLHPVALLSAADPLTAMAAWRVDREFWARVPVQLDAEGTTLTAEFVPPTSGAYALRFEDKEGVVGSRLFDLRLFADPSPTVHLERPSPSQDSLVVLPEAILTVAIQAEDSLFAVRSVGLSYRGGLDEPWRVVPMYDHAAVAASAPLLLAGMARSGWLPTPHPPQLRPDRIEIRQRLPLARLRHLDGSPFGEGDVVFLQAHADDFDDVSFDKPPGVSHQIELRVVGRSDFEAWLHQAQALVQQELVRLLALQREALPPVIGAEQMWRNTGILRSPDLEALRQAEQIQQRIRARIGTKREGLRGEVERIRRALRDNGWPRSGAGDRMDVVAEELGRLATDHLPVIEPSLAEARKEAESKPAAAPPSTETKGPLPLARKHQEEVERAVADLLRLLEPWGSIQTVKGETRAILEDVKKLWNKTGELLGSIPRGQPREALTPEQKAALDREAALAGKFAERLVQLLDKIERLARERKDDEPELGEALREAARIGREGDAAGRLRHSGQALEQNQLGAASDDQRRAVQTLEDVLRLLDERRERELDRLVKKMKRLDERLRDLAERQDVLSKKIKAAAGIGDPAQRADELQRLAREQRRLEREMRETLDELTRLRADRTARTAAEASGEMGRVAERLERGEPPNEEEDNPLARLQQARKQLGQARREAEDELAREQLARMADLLKALKMRQESALAESERLFARVMQKKSWDRSLLVSLLDLAGSQDALAEECRTLAESKLARAAVFACVVGKAAEAMEGAAERMRSHRDKALDDPEETLGDAQITRRQQTALAHLASLLDALKPESGETPGQGRSSDPDEDPLPTEEEPRRPNPNADGIPHLAQLKALRALQVDLNQRTAEFGKKHPDLARLSDEAQAELRGLEREQREIADLFDELIPRDEGERK